MAAPPDCPDDLDMDMEDILGVAMEGINSSTDLNSLNGSLLPNLLNPINDPFPMHSMIGGDNNTAEGAAALFFGNGASLYHPSGGGSAPGPDASLTSGTLGAVGSENPTDNVSGSVEGSGALLGPLASLGIGGGLPASPLLPGGSLGMFLGGDSTGETSPKASSAPGGTPAEDPMEMESAAEASAAALAGAVGAAALGLGDESNSAPQPETVGEASGTTTEGAAPQTPSSPSQGSSQPSTPSGPNPGITGLPPTMQGIAALGGTERVTPGGILGATIGAPTTPTSDVAPAFPLNALGIVPPPQSTTPTQLGQGPTAPGMATNSNTVVPRQPTPTQGLQQQQKPFAPNLAQQQQQQKKPSKVITLPENGPIEFNLSKADAKELLARMQALIQPQGAEKKGTDGILSPSVGGGKFAPVQQDEVKHLVLGKFKRVFKTDGTAHNGETVHSFVHVKDSVSPLGVLYSTAPGCLNCWNCGHGKPHGSKSKKKQAPVEPHLALSTSHKDLSLHLYCICHLGDPEVLVGVGKQEKTGQAVLASFSADQSDDNPNFLQPKAIVNMALPSWRAVSLQAVSDQYSGCVATSTNNTVMVYDLKRAPDFSNLAMNWVAHEDFVCCIRAAPMLRTPLLTGSLSGDVHSWDLRQPTRNPALKLYYHSRLVTDIQAVEPTVLYTCSADTSVLQWDLRNVSVPVNMFVPDMKCVLCVRHSPTASNFMAVSTLKGLYCLDVHTHELLGISPEADKITYPYLEWNTVNGVLYCCKLNGELEVWQYNP
eukprot:TRINITY_DN63989_c0_g1_i1.p1 TRINITY_DN63989_c0_g1~~TRINITY_DN63989_c0_g1_i1.p1  ORF type:complete len:780 (-),score=112.26 TRINITY_DN63989_c0_g1_i1:126-2432(-)